MHYGDDMTPRSFLKPSELNSSIYEVAQTIKERVCSALLTTVLVLDDNSGIVVETSAVSKVIVSDTCVSFKHVVALAEVLSRAVRRRGAPNVPAGVGSEDLGDPGGESRFLLAVPSGDGGSS